MDEVDNNNNNNRNELPNSPIRLAHLTRVQRNVGKSEMKKDEYKVCMLTLMQVYIMKTCTRTLENNAKLLVSQELQKMRKKRYS